MPGSGQLIPNSSMHWHVSQDDDNGPHDFRGDLTNPGDAAAGSTAARGTQQGKGAHTPLTSVNNGKYLYGIDPSPTPAMLRVRLRFETQDAAQAALQNAKVTAAGGLFEVAFQVPITQSCSSSEAAQAPDNPFARLLWNW